MIRKELGKLYNVRQSFIGKFKRFGKKIQNKQPTILLLNIYAIDRKSLNIQSPMLTDHLWFNLTKQFQALDLHKNDLVIFDARVKEYTKGFNKKIDYKLSHPYHITKITSY